MCVKGVGAVSCCSRVRFLPSEYFYPQQKRGKIKKSRHIIKPGRGNTPLCETVYHPAVEYTIPQSFLTATQLQHIEQEALPNCMLDVATTGIPHEMSSGDPEMLAAEDSPHYKKLLGQAMSHTHFLKYFQSPHEDDDKLMCIVLVWALFQTIQTRLPFPILSRPSTEISYVDGRYSFILSCIT